MLITSFGILARNLVKQSRYLLTILHKEVYKNTRDLMKMKSMSIKCNKEVKIFKRKFRRIT